MSGHNTNNGLNEDFLTKSNNIETLFLLLKCLHVKPLLSCLAAVVLCDYCTVICEVVKYAT